MKDKSDQAEYQNKAVYRVQGFTCTNCAAQFESNVKSLPEVQDAQVNFGASKVTVYGKVSISELEKAGAFEGLKVYSGKVNRPIEKMSFWKKRSTITSLVSAVFLAIGWLLGENNPISTVVFIQVAVDDIHIGDSWS